MRHERFQDEATQRRESAPLALPAGTPTWITPELIEATQKVWEPHYGRPLSPEEAITIVQNAGRLFELLSRE